MFFRSIWTNDAIAMALGFWRRDYGIVASGFEMGFRRCRTIFGGVVLGYSYWDDEEKEKTTTMKRRRRRR